MNIEFNKGFFCVCAINLLIDKDDGRDINVECEKDENDRKLSKFNE